MKVKDVFILQQAVDDLQEARSFYELQESGIGEYFWDCLISDIESLIIYAGIHNKSSGFYCMYSKRFPYVIYYEITDDIAYVAAVLSMRRNPVWIEGRLNQGI